MCHPPQRYRSSYSLAYRPPAAKSLVNWLLPAAALILTPRATRVSDSGHAKRSSRREQERISFCVTTMSGVRGVSPTHCPADSGKWGIGLTQVKRPGSGLVGQTPWSARDALVPLPEAEAGAFAGEGARPTGASSFARQRVT